jgi:hypothetical protein
MPGFVDETVKEIDTRLKELQEEVSRLQAARNALLGTGRRSPGRPRGAAAGEKTSRSGTGTRGASGTRGGSGTRRGTRRPGRPRGRRGGNTRANQALELVRQQPGITIPQIAESLKIEPNYLYRVMPKLVGEGLITREGQGWHPAGDGQ